MGLFFRNANAQSPIVKYNGDSQTRFSYITTGGQLEVYFMFKGSAKSIISMYQNLVGKPNLPPMWALGWHASNNLHTNISLLMDTLNGYKNAEIPLEGVWIDLSYTKNGSEFTVNSTSWPNIKELTQSLQNEGKHVVLKVNPGLKADANNTYYS